MARYRKIDPRIWNDEKFRTMSHEGQRLFLFVLTHPSLTMIGAMRATQSGLSEELGLDAKAFREAFGEALSKGMLKYDEKAFLLWLPNFLKYNAPESPNVVKSWGSALDLLPECDLRKEVLSSAKAFISTMSKAFAEALPKAFKEALPKAISKTIPNQEQEQEQDIRNTKETQMKPTGFFTETQTEPKHNPNEEKPASRKSDDFRDTLVEKIVSVYRETTTGYFSQIQAVTEKRKRSVKKFIDFYRKQVNAVDEAAFLSAVREYFCRAVRSPFLTGQNERGWRADFDFLMNENKALALLEGKYDGHTQAPASKPNIFTVPTSQRSMQIAKAENYEPDFALDSFGVAK